MNGTKYRILLSTVATVTLMLFSACGNKPDCPTFTVKGKIENAAGKSIYLSNIGINGNIILDSAKIDKNGLYTFQPATARKLRFLFHCHQREKADTFCHRLHRDRHHQQQCRQFLRIIHRGGKQREQAYKRDE